uniref:Putative mitochondrial 2-oxodicarboxylate carrier n=1 Tax=Talaromyces marneffei PM1 TaxID=1077442 RepID=A0A093VEB7_TALMA
MRPATSSYVLYGASVLFASIAVSTSASTGVNSTDIAQQYGQQLPSVVRKMGDDEGGNFILTIGVGMAQTYLEPQPALLPHTSTDAESLLSAEGKRDYARSARRALFMLLGRDFQCPTGYTCVAGGCAFVSTYTVTRQSTTFVSSSTVSITSSTTHTTTTTTTTSSSISPTSTETSSTVSPAAPVRPTTSSQTTITSSTPSSTSVSSTVSTCPTGFYACSAVYAGGCCRTGRNCDTTSCPATPSTTLINTDGITIAVPTGSAATTATESSGSCATGWFSCAASAGGGCCPNGYVCGSSCTASSSGTATATVVKEQPGVGGSKSSSVVVIYWLTAAGERTSAKADSPTSPHSGLSTSHTTLNFFICALWSPLPSTNQPIPTQNRPRDLSDNNLSHHSPPCRRPRSLFLSRTNSPPVRLRVFLKYPLDVVKTRIQLQSGTATGEEAYSSMLDCFRKIIRNEGASRLYRGITAPILMEAPKRATKFAANDSWGAFYRNLFGIDKPTQSLAVLTGATAGATESFVVVPFELVKIRLQDKAQAHKYNGMIDVVTKIVKEEGVLAMYNGLESTLWRHILWNAGYFGCIFQVREQLPKPDPNNKSQKVMTDMLAGAIGGTAGTILNTPMDVVKSRIQNSPKVAGTVPKYNWAWPAVATVAREEGFGALYKGFLPKVLRLGPGGGILLVVFTGVMDFFRTLRAE